MREFPGASGLGWAWAHPSEPMRTLAHSRRPESPPKGPRMYAGVPTRSRIPVTVVCKEILRMTLRLRGTGRAFTDRVKGLRGDSVDDVIPRTGMPAPRQTTRSVGTLRLPTAPAAVPHAGAMNLANVALYSVAAHSQSVAAGPRKNRNGEPTRQAERLAAWEDEGGATACVK